MCFDTGSSGGVRWGRGTEDPGGSLQSDPAFTSRRPAAPPSFARGESKGGFFAFATPLPPGAGRQTTTSRPAPRGSSSCGQAGSMAAGAEVGAWSRRLLLRPRIILFGDSITEFSFHENGWGASLAHRLARKCDVLNRGLSGYNTRWAKIVLPRLIHKDSSTEKTVAVTVFFGANDSALKDVNPKQHVPLDEYADNLKSMVQYLKSVDIAEDKIILVTPPPLHETAWGKECIAKGEKLNRLNATTGEYAKACVKIARDCGIEVVDLWTLMQTNNQDFSRYLSDGLHLSVEGSNFLAHHLWSVLERKTLGLPLLLPYWRDINPLHPEASLLESPQE